MYTKCLSKIETLRKTSCAELVICSHCLPDTETLVSIPLWAGTCLGSKLSLQCGNTWARLMALPWLQDDVIWSPWLLRAELGWKGLDKELQIQDGREHSGLHSLKKEHRGFRLNVRKHFPVDTGWIWNNVKCEGCRMTSWGPIGASGGQRSQVRDGTYIWRQGCLEAGIHPLWPFDVPVCWNQIIRSQL